MLNVTIIQLTFIKLATGFKNFINRLRLQRDEKYCSILYWQSVKISLGLLLLIIFRAEMIICRLTRDGPTSKLWLTLCDLNHHIKAIA